MNKFAIVGLLYLIATLGCENQKKMAVYASFEKSTEGSWFYGIFETEDGRRLIDVTITIDSLAPFKMDTLTRHNLAISPHSHHTVSIYYKELPEVTGDVYVPSDFRVTKIDSIISIGEDDTIKWVVSDTLVKPDYWRIFIYRGNTKVYDNYFNRYTRECIIPSRVFAGVFSDIQTYDFTIIALCYGNLQNASSYSTLAGVISKKIKITASN